MPCGHGLSFADGPPVRLIHPLSRCLRQLPLAAALCWPSISLADTPLDPLIVDGYHAELDDSGVQIRVPVDPLQTVDLASLLSTLPGVQVRRSGGLGAYSEASLRGSNGRQVRLLLDGQPLDSGGGEASSLALISPLMLQDVTVHKGRVPIDLAGGLAGSINLRTPETLRAPLLGTASIGSFGERQAHAAAQLAPTLQLAAGTQQADNDFRYRNTFKPFDPTDPDRRRREPRLNADTAQRYALLQLRAPVRIGAHVIDDEQSLPTRLNLPNQTAQLDTRAYGLSVATADSSLWQHRLGARWFDERYRDRDSQVGLGAQDTRSRTFRIDGQSRYRFANGNLGVLDAGHTRYRAEDQIGEAPTAEAERWQLGGAAETVHDLGAWRANASLGLQWSEDRADGQSDDHWQWAPAVGLTRRLGPCIAAGNLGSRERLATFFERYGDRGFFRGNPELRPERAHYADIGARCAPAGGAWTVDATVFGQDLRDAISPTFNAQGVGRSINTERAEIYGLEWGTTAYLGDWHAQLSGTLQHTEDRSRVRATRGKQLPGRYAEQLNARLEYALWGLRLHYAFSYEHGQFYDSPNLLEAAPLRRHDVGVRGQWLRLGWSVQALNLRDDNPEQFNGFPTPGRHLRLTLSYPAVTYKPDASKE
jgi:outer membrane cobalamin receptor